MGVDLPRQVDSVYLGGGTPSLLAPELLAKLFTAMRERFDFDPDAEITAECAPGQLADEVLNALVAAGVNRVSLGVQSFIDRETQVSGRLHNRAIVIDDLRRLRAAGIANINVDLIAGLAGQTFASWEESLAVLAECHVPHASVYMLEVDEDSRWAGRCSPGVHATTPSWFPPTTPSPQCTRQPSRNWPIRAADDWSSTRFEFLPARLSVPPQSALLAAPALPGTRARCFVDAPGSTAGSRPL